MNNREKVLRYIAVNSPRRVSNSDIRAGTSVRPHQQIFQITQSLLKSGVVAGAQQGHEWYFWIAEKSAQPQPQPAQQAEQSDQPAQPAQPAQPEHQTVQDAREASANELVLTSSQFESLAATVMSRHFGKNLSPAMAANVPKLFDLVSADGAIVGDAKYYTLVHRAGIPPAKFSVIAEYVWLLEKVHAAERFLVFGNQREVPVQWLRRYGALVSNVAFYFLSNEGVLEQLK